MKKIFAVMVLITNFSEICSQQTEVHRHFNISLKKIIYGVFRNTSVKDSSESRTSNYKNEQQMVQLLENSNIPSHLTSDAARGEYLNSYGRNIVELSDHFKDNDERKSVALLHAQTAFHKAAYYYISAFGKTDDFQSKKLFMEKADSAMEGANRYDSWYLEKILKGDRTQFEIPKERLEICPKIRGGYAFLENQLKQKRQLK